MTRGAERFFGLLIIWMLTQADGTAERGAALLMVHREWRRNRRWGLRKRISAGADKAYDMRDFVRTLCAYGVRPHVAQNLKRTGGSAIDRRTTRKAGYQIDQKKRPLNREGLWLDEADRRDVQRPNCAAYGRLDGSS